ncbi:MAG: hypothetical protein HY000_10300 [Planctomycetes bacterium]|nr:hypothetical protein [Planctomycetota bacterium]
MFTRRTAARRRVTKCNNQPSLRTPLSHLLPIFAAKAARRGNKRNRLGDNLQIESLEQRQLLTASVRIEAIDDIASEASGTLTFRVFASLLDEDESVDVDFTTVFPGEGFGFAEEGVDFTISPSDGVTITEDGNFEAFADITVTPIDDDLPELSETVQIDLLEGDYNIADPFGTAIGTIEDDSDSPKVRITANDPTASEEGPETGQFTITLDTEAEENVTVSYTVTGTATNGTDYNSGSLR